jgi:hypothetical protein
LRLGLGLSLLLPRLFNTWLLLVAVVLAVTVAAVVAAVDLELQLGLQPHWVLLLLP